MALTLYKATVTYFLQILPSAVGLLGKAEAWAAEQGLSPEEMLSKSISPDMWPLAKQFTTIANHTAGAIQGVEQGRFSPDISAPPLDYARLRTILTDAIASLKSVDAGALDAMADKEIAFEFGGEVRMRFVAEEFLLSFSVPNFAFHVMAAYSILRGLGVAVGKRDYLGTPRIIVPA